MMWMDSTWGWLWWPLGALFMVVFWGLVIAGIVLLVRWLWGLGQPTPRQESALDILKKRYARGEISKAEFEEKKRDIV